jgi:hypothetical protein
MRSMIVGNIRRVAVSFVAYKESGKLEKMRRQYKAQHCDVHNLRSERVPGTYHRLESVSRFRSIHSTYPPVESID